MVRDAGEEEWIAVAAPVREWGERGRDLLSEARTECCPHVVLVEELERQLGPVAVQLQIELERAQRVLVQDHLGRTVGRQQQQAGRLTPPRQRRDQIERRRVAPVQILEDQDQRRVGGERTQGFDHLAQHAPRRGTEALGEQPGALGLLDQGRHLQQPGRRAARELGDPALATGAPAETVDRLEQRQIGLARAVLRWALTARDPHLARGADLAQEDVDQRGLADARLAGDEEHLAPPVARRREGRAQLGERRLAPTVAPEALRYRVESEGAEGELHGLGRLRRTRSYRKITVLL